MHPLIRLLQADVANLRNKKVKTITEQLTDDDPFLKEFCKDLEAVFLHGRLDEESREFFTAIEALANEEKRDQGLNALTKHIVSEIRKISCLVTNVGRGRYFLRCCLHHGWLNSLVMSLRTWKEVEKFYRLDALVLRDPKDSIMEVLPTIQLLHFNLNLVNRAFLDYSWDLPTYKTIEVVPCSDLGLMICSVRGSIVVSRVKPGSAAGENGRVSVGDVLDNVDGIFTFSLEPDEVAKIVKRCARRPIRLGIVKAEWKCGKVFPPIEGLLEDLGINVKHLEDSWEKKRLKKQRNSTFSLFNDGEDEFDPLLDDEDDDSERLRKQIDGELTYLGSVKIGKTGNSGQLDKTILRIKNDPQRVQHSVSLYISELGIKLYNNETEDLVLDHAFPEISACGCMTTNFHYLGIIIGNDLCPLATEFMCHVFHCSNQSKAKTIVSRIAEGFQRTRDAV